VQWGGCENCGSSLVSVETSKDYEFPFGGHQYEGASPETDTMANN
jgi:hypothetical protein